MVIGGILSACMGVTFPALSTFLGGSIDSFGLESQRLEEARKNLFNMIYLGAGALVGGSIMFTFWNITGQKQAIKCRKEFFRSLIKQEMGWLDTQNIAELVNAFTVDVLTF
jgi:ATP-binding cassette subfamily B (MDR/TAP) protein 1